MKKTQKRAFILSECKSPYIAQAIFVLKDGVSEHEHGVLADAERIVASYMSDGKYSKEKNENALYIKLAVGITVFLSAVAVTLAYIL